MDMLVNCAGLPMSTVLDSAIRNARAREPPARSTWEEGSFLQRAVLYGVPPLLFLCSIPSLRSSSIRLSSARCSRSGAVPRFGVHRKRPGWEQRISQQFSRKASKWSSLFWIASRYYCFSVRFLVCGLAVSGRLPLGARHLTRFLVLASIAGERGGSRQFHHAFPEKRRNGLRCSG